MAQRHGNPKPILMTKMINKEKASFGGNPYPIENDLLEKKYLENYFFLHNNN